jgi:glycosyltransferase involved in cell wall biosynthesis
MKILMVIDALGKGGKERRMLELIKGLKADGNNFDIYLVSLTDTVEYNYVYDLPIRFEIIKRKTKKDLSVVFKLNKIINNFQPDIIHSWSTMSSVFLSASNLFARKPMINAVLADSYPALGLSDKHYFRVKLTTPFSKVFVSNSFAAISSYKTPKGKSICIYNGIDFSRFENLKPATQIEKEILGDQKLAQKVIAMVSTFDHRKDFETLVRAAIRMCEKRNDIVFLLIGSGPSLQKVKAQVPKKLLGTRIIFTGKQDYIESILQIVDVGVLMTNADRHAEGVSNSIIEYMASGKPVIASRGGGTDEVIQDGFNGLLVEPKNETDLVSKLESLLNHPAKLKEMGSNAYSWVRQNFDLTDKTKEYVELYEGLLRTAK